MEAAFDGTMDIVGGKVAGTVGKQIGTMTENGLKKSMKAEVNAVKNVTKANNAFNKVTNGGQNVWCKCDASIN